MWYENTKTGTFFARNITRLILKIEGSTKGIRLSNTSRRISWMGSFTLLMMIMYILLSYLTELDKSGIFRFFLFLPFFFLKPRVYCISNWLCVQLEG
jgi:uncharacterized membrane protein YhdT